MPSALRTPCGERVWAMDITYIPMARGFVYLAVVLDWFSRRVLSCKLSQCSIALDGSKRHPRLEGRCVVPAWSFAHCLS